jgi:CRP/FNR family cyclic AMP-dependent transcriptional regulator
MAQHEMRSLDVDVFPAQTRQRHRILKLEPEESIFSQGSPSESVFYLQKGRAKVTVVSRAGKEATVTILSAGDFLGEESLAEVPGLRLSTATAITECIAL